jgi:transcriptional regulator with XRE-family HTH domain
MIRYMAYPPGELIRRLRTKAGLKQAELADRAGTSQSALSAYERGDKDPNWSTLVRVADVLGYDIGIVPRPRAKGFDRADADLAAARGPLQLLGDDSAGHVDPDEPTFADKILAIDDAWGQGRFRHAFAGGIASAYYTVDAPSVTDIDLIAFADNMNAIEVIETLPYGVRHTIADIVAAARDNGVTLWWGPTPIHVRFDGGSASAGVARRVVRQPLGGRTVAVVAAEDLPALDQAASEASTPDRPISVS